MRVIMADLQLSESEIFAALRLLSASDGQHSRKDLESILESEIKNAYRKKALSTHPDRFATRSAEYQKLCSQRFIEVNNAYETLITYVRAKERGFNFTREDAVKNWSSNMQDKHPRQPYSSEDRFNGSRDNFTRTFWQKDAPGRRLRFGEFLYYSGVIDWRVLRRALAWQSKHRPRLGEIAQRWHWVDEPQITRLIKNSRSPKPIGELMLIHNLINRFQLNVLLRQQNKIKKPIGQYFVQQRLMTEGEIRRILCRQRKHNLEFRPI